MGVMDNPLAPVKDQPPLVLTPHAITLEGQQFLPVELRDGETLGAFLDRTIDLGADAWEVKIGGVVVPVAMWDRVKPKHGHLIEVRGAVKKQALYIVAMIALVWFTGGMAAAGGFAGVGGMVTGSAMGAMAINAAVFMVGAMVINKVLGPKPPEVTSRDRESVYNIGSARNALRPHEPLGLLFGRTLVAPDVISQPYSYYSGNDQYVAMVLTPGLNVARFDELYFGDTPLSSYQGVQVWTSGFSGMPEQEIPIHSNVDTVAGGELTSTGWVTRTTSPNTLEVMVNVEYLLFGIGTSGKNYYVSERVEVQYRPVGTSTWQQLTTRNYRSDKQDPRRDTISAPVPRGQYDVRVRISGLGNYEGANTQENRFTWTTLGSVQADDADYRGIPRIGIRIKATGQLNGAPDQIRAVMHQQAMPFWTGTAWVTATGDRLSNPGAQILQYARGYFDPDGNLVAGMGLPDSMIDIPAFQAFMQHCEANGYAYDYWLQSPRSHREVRDSIALAGFGQTTWAGGRLSVAWAAQSQPLTGVVNMATIKKGEFEVDYTLVNAADGIEYSYFDRDTLQVETLRVPAPGVVTMLNPARMTGEGVSTEAHAAEMARYHLAQHLYQFKSIGYSTDLEHMTYRRLSVLALSHDMTKWGSSGRVVSASLDGDVATVELDEPVAAPTTGKAYIGLRIPGERVYRVFEVAPFTGESDTLVLADPWPSDADLPGNSDDNPAHDTIWIYDFQSTPGYRVRVTSIEPESGLKGARISCVPEGPEFWTYVKTGHYEPPVQIPPSNSRPVASNLVISENQVLVGSGEFTELTATFDVTGRASHSVVYAGLIDQPLEEVAQTSTRTATWRIDEAGEYAVVVRPFDEEGNAGEAVSARYITSRADVAPPVFDWFEVQELSGGVRSYLWGYYGTTMRAANLAGAEIRYIDGNMPSPIWDTMTPLGDEAGFFTGPFEMVIPPSGTWTFAIRARNTSGTLSDGVLTIVRTLQGNLGEVIERVYSDLSEGIGGVNDRVDAIAAQVSDIVGAEEWDASETYAAGDLVKRLGKMYRAIQASINQPPESNPDDWQLIGEYSSLGEAVAAAISIGNINTSDIAAEAIRTDALYARMPGGMGALATSAMVAAEASARSDGDTALASQLNFVRASVDETFTAARGWQFITNVNDFTVNGATLDSFPVTEDFGALVVNATSADPQFISPPVAVDGRRNPIVRAMVRRRNNMTWEGALYWSTVDRDFFGWPHLAFPNAVPPVGEWAVVEWDLTESADWRDSTITCLRFDFAAQLGAAVDVRWIVIGDKGPGVAASVAQEMVAEVDAVSGRLAAKHTVALDVNGYVSGTLSENDGYRASFRVLADFFGVENPGGGAGLSWEQGTLWNRRGGYSMLAGPDLGEGMMFYIGTTPTSPAAAAKANAMFYVDSAGTGYFAGRVLQGVIRTFESSTTVGNVTVTGPSTSSNNKPVSLEVKIRRQRVQTFNGTNVTVTPGAGVTQARVQIQRRYGVGGYTTLADQYVAGDMTIIQEPGFGARVIYRLNDAVMATDVADLRARNYRVVISELTLQNWTATGQTSTPPPTDNQYVAIESME